MQNKDGTWSVGPESGDARYRDTTKDRRRRDRYRVIFYTRRFAAGQYDLDRYGPVQDDPPLVSLLDDPFYTHES